MIFCDLPVFSGGLALCCFNAGSAELQAIHDLWASGTLASCEDIVCEAALSTAFCGDGSKQHHLELERFCVWPTRCIAAD